LYIHQSKTGTTTYPRTPVPDANYITVIPTTSVYMNIVPDTLRHLKNKTNIANEITVLYDDAMRALLFIFLILKKKLWKIIVNKCYENDGQNYLRWNREKLDRE
jgi:hypothetical protein